MFRRHAGREKRPGRKGSRGSFRNKFTVPKGEDGTPVVFVPGEYPDPRPDERSFDGRPVNKSYYIFKEHRKKVKGQNWPITDTCAAGWNPSQPKPCVYCHERKQGDLSIDGRAGVARTMYALNLTHLVPYHLVPQVDKRTNEVRINPNTGEPYLGKTACEGRGCPHCRENYQLLFGAKKYLQVGPNHLQDLKQIAADISSSCSNCREGEVKTASFECPDCGYIIVDCLSNDFGEDEIDQFAMDQLTCPSCRKTNVAIETLECTHCQDPRRTTLFDVVLWLRRTGESTDSHLSLKHPSPRHFGWCWLDEFFVNEDEDRPLITGWSETDEGVLVPEWDEDIEKMTKPYDFDEMIAVGKPKSTAAQAERLGINDPYAANAGQPPARDYGKGPNRPSRV